MSDQEVQKRLDDLEQRLAAIENHPSITGVINGVQHTWGRMQSVPQNAPIQPAATDERSTQ